ncbi:MAG: hypothetical protein KKI08_19695 [Armatimonadetes bacterium]|nr:hypothetical protein [Armatimonadota bacterium]
MASKVYLVESIPTGLDDLKVTQGVDYSGPTLKRLTDAAQHTIDLTAMYWALNPNPATRDDAGFTVEQLLTEYAAHEGADLYEALQNAARRGVKIRILESPGFDPTSDESGDLQRAFPEQIERHPINMPDWYGSGIMHQKIWVFDGQSIYLGSANNDWKSLTQVKEIGIVVEEDAAIAAEFTRYFNAWWAFSDPALPVAVKDAFDPDVRVSRQVPAWSPLLPETERAANPLNRPELQSECSWERPLALAADGVSGGMFLSGAPLELCVGGRTPDLEALVKTIQEAQTSVCICVMDFAPVSLYRGEYDREKHKCVIGDQVATPAWWSDLFDAVLHSVTTQATHVRLLVSEWAHSSGFITPYLKALQAAADAAHANHLLTAGKLEIKRFQIPGWDCTTDHHGEFAPQAAAMRYPGHTRVNHTKYIVTDRRANIGTSNMTWDYFSGTAGASVNTDHAAIVAKLQEIFDRDWDSPYAHPQV